MEPNIVEEGCVTVEFEHGKQGQHDMDIPAQTIMKWATNLHQYFVFVQREEDPENHVEPFKVYLDTIADILAEIARKTTPNDKWELSFMGDILHVRSEKLQHVIRFGTWLDIEFNMETEILYPQYLVRMPDLFWKQILELGEYGKFEFVDYSIPDSPPELAVQAKKKTKSNLYRIVRHSILCEAQNNDSPVGSDDKYDDFGFLQVSWPVNIRFEDLLNNMSEIFKRFYQINYMLYRHEYILTHSKHKKSSCRKS